MRSKQYRAEYYKLNITIFRRTGGITILTFVLLVILRDPALRHIAEFVLAAVMTTAAMATAIWFLICSFLYIEARRQRRELRRT